MLKFSKVLIVLLLIVSSFRQAAAYNLQFADDAQTLRLRWKTNVIQIALSTSLTKPNPFIKADTDVTGAIERSFAAWEKAADVKFQIVWTDKQTASPAGKSGDGTNLVTIASTPENLLLFSGEAQEVSARTRVFFNRKGNITESDIVLNPYEQFTTDGAAGTFDLEATLTHEIGHLLGLEHASVTGATMHAHIGKNGVYNLPGFGARTLSEDDITGVRALYGANSNEGECCGTISGKLSVGGRSAKDFQVWAEHSDSGRIAAGVLTKADGSFQIEGLSVGSYKIYTQSIAKDISKSSSVEKIGEIEIAKDKIQNLVKKLTGAEKRFNSDYLGFNGQIANLAVPVNAGKYYTIYIGGTNLKAENLKVEANSPYLKINPKSLTDHNYGENISVVSFEIKVADDIPLGEYSFIIRGNKEESQAVVGGITVDKFVNPWNSYFLNLQD